MERLRRAARLMVIVLGMCGAAAAVSPLRAQVSSVAIWYRSGVGCPDSDAFLRALAEKQVQGHVATVGERIDFVVTLGMGGGDHSKGVIERQTDGGVVALRSVEDQSCALVADALALTLALSLDEAPEAPPATLPSIEAQVPRQPLSSDAVTDANARIVVPPERPDAVERAANDSPGVARTATSWFVGAQTFGFTSSVAGFLPGAALLVEADVDGPSLLRPAIRLAMSGAYRVATLTGGQAGVSVLAVRLQACPFRAGSGAWRIRPCAAADVGEIRGAGEGSTGRDDSGLFVSTDLSGRLTWLALQTLALDGELGLALPITRYELGGNDARRAAILGLRVGVGLAMHFP